VPEKGARIVLREVFRGNRDVGLRVEGEVVWTIAKATLENPETGYAVQFSEAWTEGDTAPLKDFANTLNPGQDHHFEQASRDGRQVTLYRFPELSSAETGPTMTGPSTYDALPEVDLASELDRLDRQQRRRGGHVTGNQDTAAPQSKALSYYTRARPKKKVLDKKPSNTGSQPQVEAEIPHEGATVHGEAVLQPPAETASLDLEGPIDPQGGEGPHASPRRRRFGGLLGLFGFGKEEGGEQPPGAEDSNFDVSGGFDYVDEAEAEGDDWYVSDEDPSLVRLSWKDNDTEGVVEKVSATMMAINTRGPAPLHYERVTVVPAFPTLTSSRLLMHGTVTRIKDKHGDGSQTVLIRFSKVDERGKNGVFQEYLKVFE